MSERPESLSQDLRITSCPVCQKVGSLRYRPFCSKRCADVDLNRWLSGSYAIPVTEESDEDGDEAFASPPAEEQ